LSEYKYALAGADWGFADPSVLLTGMVGTDGLVHLVDEYYVRRTPIQTIAEAAAERREKYDIQTFWCDPSRPEYVQELRNHGLDSRKAKNEIDPGIAGVTRHIERGLFRMDFNTCPETAREFEVYHYPEDDLGKLLKDRPVDADNHCMDALRYMIYSHQRQGHASSRRGTR
jgi:phage terminase large subunit